MFVRVPLDPPEPEFPIMKYAKDFFLQESAFLFGTFTTVLFYLFSDVLLAGLAPDLKTVALFLWIFATMLWCSFGVVRHADFLAEQLGEPYGTLILTLSVISIEVSLIASIMLSGANEPTLARDTMFAVLMIVLNGMVGITLLIGGLKHREQHYNLQGAKAFLAVLVTLSVLTLVLPKVTVSTPLPTFTPYQEVFFATITILLYGVFLGIQTVRHKGLFLQPGERAQTPHRAAESEAGKRVDHLEVRSVLYHAVLLLLTMLPVVLLSKKLALFVDFGIEGMGAPVALGGLIIAILVLTPEGIGALHAARANQLQRSVNILLGSALATIGLTVPAVLTISLVIDRYVELGLNDVETLLLLLTLAVSALTFTGGRTNILQGALHLVLFFAYVFLIFNP
ncbi:MAG: calcium:proton antiporter [Pseudomonadota bacterium]|nr:calcium:proton antiporter [Pseudomonadota bacterium]